VIKGVTLYALTSTGTVQTQYNGSVTVMWSANGAGLSLGTSESGISALNTPVALTFHQGVAQVDVTTGSGAVGSQAKLVAHIPGSTLSSRLALTDVSGNPKTQAGYRVFTPDNTPRYRPCANMGQHPI
jgi:hypothetical protein